MLITRGRHADRAKHWTGYDPRWEAAYKWGYLCLGKNDIHVHVAKLTSFAKKDIHVHVAELTSFATKMIPRTSKAS